MEQSPAPELGAGFFNDRISDCETPVAACSGWADSVAGFYADTSYPKSRIC